MPTQLHRPWHDATRVARRSILGAALAFPLVAHGRNRQRLLYRDSFDRGLAQWRVECEQPGSIRAAHGTLDIDVPRGATMWFRHRLTGPIAVDYTVTPIAAGGPNDRVSDVNCFWMAHDPAVPAQDVFARPRSGAFEDYDSLQTYYAGIGGNGNTTSRFRRYVGTLGNRPLLPQHDLRDAASLLQPNQPLQLRLLANGSHIALLRGGQPVFVLDDEAPYRSGYFGLRTTQSHLQVRDFRVWRLL